MNKHNTQRDQSQQESAQKGHDADEDMTFPAT